MSGPGASCTRSLERMTPGDVELALHRWAPEAPRAVVFYVHGIQSHAGWLFETGEALAARGVLLYVLDRRGSGISGGARGDATSFSEWMDDYTSVLAEVRRRHPGLRLTLLGQSMGGSVATGIACDPRATHDALLLCAPALNQARTRLSPEVLRARREDRRASPLQPVPLEDGSYTALPRYLAFMKDDPLMLREVTPRFTASRLDLDDHYMNLDQPLRGRPAMLVLPRQDRIIDLVQARRAFEALTGGGSVVDTPVDGHYLEFSEWRTQFCDLIAAFATSTAGGGGC